MRLSTGIMAIRRSIPDGMPLSLGSKVLIPALALSICASLALFGWFGHKLAKQGIEDLQSRLQVFSSTQAADLVQPMWTFDEMLVDRLVHSYALNNDLLHARLYDAKGNLLEEVKGQAPTGAFDTYVAEKQITRESGGHTYAVGRLEVAYHDGNVRKSLADARFADLVTLLILIVCLAGAIALAIHWQIGLPLRRLRDSLDRNKTCGLHEPLPWSSRDELGEVVAAYNALLAEVDQQTRHLQHINLTLEKENSQRRKAEEALKKQEEQLRLVLEANRDGFWDWNIRTGEFFLSPRSFEQLGYEEGERPPDLDNLRALCHPGDYERMVKAVTDHVGSDTNNAYTGEYRFLAKSGQWKWIMTRWKVFRDQTGAAIRMVGTGTDITQRKEAEEERARLATALDQMDDSVIITDALGTIGYVNPAFQMIYGYSAKEVVGRNLAELKGGQTGESPYQKIRLSLSHGAVWRGHIVQQKKDGSRLELSATISPVRDSSGTIINYVEIARDLSRELELQKQLQQAQKMEAIGTLAGGIAHDFNNILSAIIGYVQMALLNVPETNPIHQTLNQVLKAAHRAADVVKQILVISRSEVARELAPLHMEGVIREVLGFLRATIPTTIDICQDIRTKNDVVVADRTQIHQMILNLCTNAAQAMAESGGVLDVIFSEADLSDPEASARLGLAPGEYLLLTISDTGHGMSPHILERIFDPYFTTKEVGKGSGLGLAVVQGVIDRHRGAISVSSKQGRGSVFQIYLPRSDGEPPAVEGGEEEERCACAPRGAGRILFVDDEDSLADLGKQMLQELGYDIISTTDATSALADFRDRPDYFDLVITDYAMPGLNGLELAGEIMSIRPHTPIILCTGFSQSATEKKVKEHGIRAFLMKPYDFNGLGEKVREVLNREPRAAG